MPMPGNDTRNSVASPCGEANDEPVPLLGAPISSASSETLTRLLAPFEGNGAEVARAILTESTQIWYVGEEAELSRFRLAPETCLEKIQGTLAHLARTNPTPPRVAWRMDNLNNQGLDDFEAISVFGLWMDIECCLQANRLTPHSQLLIIGQLRQDKVGLAFHIRHSSGPLELMTGVGLRLLERYAPAGTILYLDHEQARRLSSRLRSGIRAQLTRLVQGGNFELGLFVPRARTERAVKNLSLEASPLASLAGSRGTRFVQFEAPEMLPPPIKLWEAMNRAGIEADTSWFARVPDGEDEQLASIDGPYFRGGAYLPQAFDGRTPAGRWVEGRPLNLISMKTSSYGDHWRRLWKYRVGDFAERLPELLDYRRMEKYYQEFDASLELAQRYPEFRVYNWQAPDTTPRTTLVDAGDVHRVLRVARFLRHAERIRQRHGESWTLVSPEELLAAATIEARDRVRASEQTILEDQREAHHYLETIPPDGPLREDLLDFVMTLPKKLGHTLELGSGYGRLARELSNRCDGYVCLDLDERMFIGLRPHMGETGVVADLHVLPFDDNRFDTVIANNVIEHSYDPLRCLQESARVLKPNGRLWALLPLDALDHRHQLPSHLWKADLDGIRAALTLAGLQPVRLDVVDLYRLKVRGAFPSCAGLICKVEAAKPRNKGLLAA